MKEERSERMKAWHKNMSPERKAEIDGKRRQALRIKRGHLKSKFVAAHEMIDDIDDILGQ